MPQKIPYWHVDAFASKPFGGNQAAVMVLDEWLPDDVLVQIGGENLFAETAFVVRDATGLTRLLSLIERLESEAAGSPALTTARLIAASALARAESRGGHFRTDYPDADPAQAQRSRLTLAHLPVPEIA